ncbi:hypothetical protein pSalSNUABM01_043 [Salmonella phage pSal-SNUABM-01]|nr:hypothetical protein pSalSNUABM01_043 [Salmonella phage pSal-SNUABM-01]
MKVAVLQVTQDSYSAYNEWEWQLKGVFWNIEDAERVGQEYVAQNPDQEYDVFEVSVLGAPNEGLRLGDDGLQRSH